MAQPAFTPDPDETEPLTADDLLRMDAAGQRGELIQGVFCETMPPGFEHSEVVSRLDRRMGNFIEPRRLGRLGSGDPGVWLARGPDTVRAPDIAFFSAETMPLDTRVPGYAEVVPDLVVEVASPNDSRYEVFDKARMWLTFGVRLAWVVHPATRRIDVHRPDHPVRSLGPDDTLDGGDVLPGFTCPVATVFGA